MFLSRSSVRARLFVVIAGMALLASFTIGLAYVATESERLDLTADARTAHQVHELTTDLQTSIRDQEAAIDDYLLSGSSVFLDLYHSAQEAELRFAERIDGLSDEFPGVRSALATLTQRSSTWRSEFADPAIAAVDSRSVTRIATIVEGITSEKEPSLEGSADLRTAIDLAEAQITVREDALADTRTIAVVFGVLLMLVAAGASLLLVRRWVTNPMDRLLRVATLVEGGTNASFEAERSDEIGKLGQALEGMRLALQGDAEQSTILNRFTEVTTFAADDTAVSAASLEALDILVKPDVAVTHVLNRSKDRAIPEATLGPAISEILPLNMLSRCPGVVRGTIYVTSDAAQQLSVHCPIYPVDHGTLACIPLAHGEVVGSVHLAWDRPNAFPLAIRTSVARIAEHAALAIANRRLLAALQGMASTDARTGLANSRSFDQALEDILAERSADETVAVLMVDIDHFKDFNDRYGHPAGDVALRAFSEVLQSCMREADLAARYGGEEFAVVLPGADEAIALGIAERIRSRTETTLISLAPGMTDRITVSIGVACAPADALDRVALLRLADDALYRAKKAGRNRVQHASAPGTVKLAEAGA